MAEAHWEAFSETVGVWVTKDHSFTTDTLLLADFSRPRPGEACADLGTGCGAITMLWVSWEKPGSVLAVELRPEAAELAERSVRDSGCDHLVQVLCGDIREYRTLLPNQRLDLIACNPPYYPMGKGEPGEGSRRAARHEETLTLEELAAAAKHGLRWGGRLCVCLRTERLAEAMEVFRRNRLEPKRLRLVQSGPDRAPYLFLLECRHGGRSGLTAEPALILREPLSYYPQAAKGL